MIHLTYFFERWNFWLVENLVLLSYVVCARARVSSSDTCVNYITFIVCLSVMSV
jgi:hypothetical protein